MKAFTNVLLLLSILDAEIEPSPLDKPSACLREIVSLKSVWRGYLSTRSSSIQDDWCNWNRCIGEYRRRPCTDCLSNREGACRFADKAIARAGPATSPSMLIAPKNVFLRASVRFLSTSTALNAVVPPTEWVRLMEMSVSLAMRGIASSSASYLSDDNHKFLAGTSRPPS
jgi:hypothetical protein